jgi:hypothetical protein
VDVPGRALVLQADRRGIVYDDEAEVPLPRGEAVTP